MTPTLKQREKFEEKRQLAIQDINFRIEILEYRLRSAIVERNALESATIEDDYFSFLADRRDEGNE